VTARDVPDRASQSLRLRLAIMLVNDQLSHGLVHPVLPAPRQSVPHGIP
jgi:hypothetical protein